MHVSFHQGNDLSNELLPVTVSISISRKDRSNTREIRAL